MSRTRNHAAEGTARVTLNFLIPGDEDIPLTPRETFVAGVNHEGLTGDYRQQIIAKLQQGQPVHLIRLPDHPNDQNAVALFTEGGKDIGYLPRDVAEEIAPRLDAGSPVTATVERVEPFEAGRGRTLLGVRLKLTPYRIKSGQPPITLNRDLAEQAERAAEGGSSNVDRRLLALIVIAIIVAIAFFHG